VEILIEVYIRKEEIYLQRILTIKHFIQRIPKMEVSIIHNYNKKNGNKKNIIQRNDKIVTHQLV